MRSAGGEPRDFLVPRAIGVMRVASDRCYVFRKTNHARLPATPRDARGRQTGMRASRAYALAALLGCLFAAASADDECSGHGTYDSSSAKCACDDSTPAPGATGWVGDACEIETVGVATPTIAAPFVQSGTLEGGRWRCYFLAVDPGWNHLAVSLSHAEDDRGDPDVHGAFFDAAARPSFPRSRTDGYDFREVSSASHAFVDVSVARADLDADAADAAHLFLCAQAYGDAATTYEMRAAFSACPTSFAPTHDAHDGSDVSITECSAPPPGTTSETSEPAGACDADSGACACAAYEDHTFQAPEDGGGDYFASSYYSERLGFGACAARIDFAFERIANAGRNTRRVASYADQTLLPGSWRFYELKVTAATDHQVVATLTRDPDAGAAEMYLRHETVPTNHWGHYDLPIDYVSGTDLTQELVMTEGDGVFEAGTWYAGVYASAGRAAAFDVDFAYYECPRNCSDRGTCVVAQNGTRHCECDLGPGGNPYLKEDCSEEFSQWSEAQSDAGSAFAVNGTLASSEYDYFALPSMDARESRRQIEVVLSASFTKAHAVYDWEEKPALLLKRGGRADFPSVSDYTFKTTLERAGEAYEIELCASQFAGATWNAAVYNPGAGEPMAFAVSFTKRAVCPSATAEECSGHGTCRSGNLADPNFATCACDDGWTASDCNFPSCPAGSYVALPPGADGGPGATCFRGCQGGKRRSSGCDAVVCAPPARAAASGSTGSAANAPTRCVLDECESDLFRVDEEKGTSCVVRCAPDENDAHGPKRLRAECDPETVRSSAREIDDDSTQNVTTYGALATAATFAAVALCVVVAAAARGVCDARGDGASVGEKLAGCWRSARGVFGGNAWERRRDLYEDVDAFERADFD